MLTIPQNVAKAEAIRRRLVQCFASGASIIGYYDADLATLPGEPLCLVERLETRPDLEFVLAARVRLLGRQRAPLRAHYLGRVFATCASLILRIPVCDTQCEAKVFPSSPAFAGGVRDGSGRVGVRRRADQPAHARISHGCTGAALRVRGDASVRVARRTGLARGFGSAT